MELIDFLSAQDFYPTLLTWGILPFVLNNDIENLNLEKF